MPNCKSTDRSTAFAWQIARNGAATTNYPRLCRHPLPFLIWARLGPASRCARHVHTKSRRSNQALIEASAANVPESLFESEFFGYAAGAYSGAAKHTPGKVESADKGSLFLDEIGDASAQIQAKLLRVVETGLVTRLGEHKERRTDVRWIFGTNRNLPQMVEDGEFRQDLWYRINTISVQVPALRDRPEDIEEIINVHLHRFAQETHKSAPKIDLEGRDALIKYSWARERTRAGFRTVSTHRFSFGQVHWF